MTNDVGARVTPRGWLTLSEAAGALGVSVHSVRRRARAGQLVARQVPTDRGPSWRVMLHPDGQGDHANGQGDATVAVTVTTDDHPSGGQGDATVSSRPDATVARQGDTLATAELVALLREREARIDELTGRLLVTTEAATIWQERARVLGEQLALRAPQEPQNGALDASGATEGRNPYPELLRLYGPLVAGVVLALVGAVLLLVWPR